MELLRSALLAIFELFIFQEVSHDRWCHIRWRHKFKKSSFFWADWKWNFADRFQLPQHFDVQFLSLKIFDFSKNLEIQKKLRIFKNFKNSKIRNFVKTYVRRAEWGSEYRLFKIVFPGVVPFWKNRPVSTCDDVLDFRFAKSLFPNAGTKSATLAPRFLINTWAIPAEQG